MVLTGLSGLCPSLSSTPLMIVTKMRQRATHMCARDILLSPEQDGDGPKIVLVLTGIHTVASNIYVAN